MENLTKEEREKLHEKEKLNLISKGKSKKIRKRILFYSITLIIISSLVYAEISSTLKPGEYDDFAKCLTEKNVKEYGAFWCSNCAEQKKLFGKSFEYINYIECDARGNNAKPELCRQKGITGYPTWEIQGKLIPGVQSLEDLAQESKCDLK